MLPWLQHRQWEQTVGAKHALSVAVHFHLWKDVPRLLELAKFQLITRPGSALQAPDELLELMGDEAVQAMIDGALPLEMPYSSTQIRHQLMEGQRPEGLHDGVWEYIRENELYT